MTPFSVGVERRQVLGAILGAPAAHLPESVAKRDDLNDAVVEVLQRERVPSASVAVVGGGQIVHQRAYGWARRDLGVRATITTRYALGSTSKQFTAVAVLRLVEQGLADLDEPIARWRPDLTRSGDITLRHLLSHGAGYPDYFPQTSVPLEIREPITPARIAERWGRAALEFEPGSAFGYSNTNYVIAGLIVQDIVGEPLFAHLQRTVFTPLGMTGAVDNDQHPIAAPDAQRFTRAGLGPPRPTLHEGAGWMFAAGGLAMRASDLAQWDLCLLGTEFLSRPSRQALLTETTTSSGAKTGYGLGFYVEDKAGRRKVSHDGQVSGFLAENRIYPDDDVAICVLVNSEVGAPNLEIADRIANLVLPPRPEEAKVFHGLSRLRAGAAPTALTPDAAAYFTPQALRDIQVGLAALGPTRSLQLETSETRGGLLSRTYRLVCRGGAAEVLLRTTTDGRIEEFLMWPSSP